MVARRGAASGHAAALAASRASALERSARARVARRRCDRRHCLAPHRLAAARVAANGSRVADRLGDLGRPSAADERHASGRNPHRAQRGKSPALLHRLRCHSARRRPRWGRLLRGRARSRALLPRPCGGQRDGGSRHALRRAGLSRAGACGRRRVRRPRFAAPRWRNRHARWSAPASAVESHPTDR